MRDLADRPTSTITRPIVVRIRRWFFLFVALLCAAAAVANDSPLEEIDAAEATAAIRASRGLLFVDLYADW